jgi:hypothetical protein
MTSPILISLQDDYLVIKNVGKSPLTLLEVNIKYEVTVITIEERTALRTVSFTEKVNKTLKPNEEVKIKTELKDISNVEIVYKNGNGTFREIFYV